MTTSKLKIGVVLSALLIPSMAYGAPALPLKFKPSLQIPISLFCKHPDPYVEIIEALDKEEVELAGQLGRLYLQTGICFNIPDKIAFTPEEVFETYPESEVVNGGSIVRGRVEHLRRGMVSVFTWLSEAAMKKATEDRDA